MDVYLIDGTYELFRQFFGRPEAGRYGATVGVLRSTLTLLDNGATHIAVASDHIIESFRNALWRGYKTSEGMEPAILEQIEVLEDALAAMGVTVWAMVEHEADDALASAARVAGADPRVGRAVIATPDKDLGQCVGGKVVQWDRRNDVYFDAAAVEMKFGVPPASIPDWLGLVGDSADGFPGLPGWGAKSAAAVLGRYGHLEDIPRLGAQWDVPVRGAEKLANTLAAQMEEAVLFRHIATCVNDLEVGAVDDWAWRGPTPRLAEVAASLGSDRLADDVARVARAARAR
jgi:5'-3' exonuclease